MRLERYQYKASGNEYVSELKVTTQLVKDIKERVGIIQKVQPTTCTVPSVRHCTLMKKGPVRMHHKTLSIPYGAVTLRFLWQ